MALWHIIVALVIISFVYLWIKSHTFRYYMKLLYYHGNYGLTTLIGLPLVVRGPRDPIKLRPYQHWWNFTQRLIGVRMEKRNSELLENLDGPGVLMMNHQSSLDFMAVYQVSPKRATFLSKKEVLYLAWFGLAGWLTGMIFIDRLNHEKARGTLEKTAQTLTNQKIKVWVFPEGTRRLGETLLPFKKGCFHLAVQAQVPIYPVVVSSYKHFLDPERKILNTGKAIISCLPPVLTEGLTAQDVTSLTDKVRTQMADEFEKISAEVRQEAKLQGQSLL